MDSTQEIDERLVILDVARAVAAELGEGWKVGEDRPDSYDHMRFVNGPDGMSFTVHGAGWAGKGRLKFSGSYPERQGMRLIASESRVSISVAADRDPASIAKEVARRFLPGYKQSYAQAVTAGQEHDAYLARKTANADRIRLALGDAATADQRDPCAFYVRMTGHTHGHGEAYDDSINFSRLSTSVEKAVRIAAILAEPED